MKEKLEPAIAVKEAKRILLKPRDSKMNNLMTGVKIELTAKKARELAEQFNKNINSRIKDQSLKLLPKILELVRADAIIGKYSVIWRYEFPQGNEDPVPQEEREMAEWIVADISDRLIKAGFRVSLFESSYTLSISWS